MFDGPVQCEMVVDCLTKLTWAQGVLNVLRYYPIAGFAFFFFYLWKKETFQRFRIQKVFPKTEKVKREIQQSAITLLVFTIVAVTNIMLIKAKILPNHVYFGKVEGALEWAYIGLSFLLITAWHETWFYWMHRFAHLKAVYPHVHSEHHQSANPTPLAAYRFQATEAFLESIYLILFLLVVPIHFYVVLFHTFYAMIFNIWWHLGYEFFPKGWASHPILKWINTSTHHNLHHQKFHGNYSLYFNVWDRLMGTNFPYYESYFDQITMARDAKKAEERTKQDLPQMAKTISA